MNESTGEIVIPPQGEEKPKPISFQELTLWQVGWLMLYHPLPTLRRFFDEIALPPEENYRSTLPDEYRPVAVPTEEALTAPIEEDVFELPTVDFGMTINILPTVVLTGLLFSLMLAFVGASRLWKATNDAAAHAEGDLKGAPVWLTLAGISYLIISVVASWNWWKQRLQQKSPPEENPAPQEASPEVAPPRHRPMELPPVLDTVLRFIERHSIQLALIPPAILMSFLSYTENVITRNGKVEEVAFTTSGFTAWVLAILLWFCVLAVDLNSLTARVYRTIRGQASFTLRRPRFQWRVRWPYMTLLLILLLAAYFRLHNLDSIPPDMTSDHIEKLRDAVRVSEGFHAIFFENNGGREAFQMYFIALLEKLPAVEFNFTAIKLASVIEGLLTVLAGYWLGQAIMGRDTPQDREMGIWLGLTFAALLAVSSWHTMISRLGLRIALTPLTTVLLMIFLARAMRYNRRFDFVVVGLILGAGTYFYQANRMLPIVVVLGTLLAAAIYSRKLTTLAAYGVNLACAGIMAVAIFLPMYRYEREFPDYFWSRTQGRLFGENAFVRTNPETGLQEKYDPTLREQADRFLDNFDNFEENYLNALKMWSWQGDGAWINNPDGRPALDLYTNGLFLIGVLAWVVLILRRWDSVHILVPIAILIMLLPSALAINPNIQQENPSFTRSSGTMPFVFLMAGYPLAQVGFYARRVSRYAVLNLTGAFALLTPVILLAAPINYDTYFHKYPESYKRSWKPYTYFAEPLKEYLENGGTFGNAFYIHWEHWLDHRILGATAGDMDWPNGAVDRQQIFALIQRNENTPYQYDPSKPLYFMYNKEDKETVTWLDNNFPGGTHFVKQHPERSDLDFGYYIVPAGTQQVG